MECIICYDTLEFTDTHTKEDKNKTSYKEILEKRGKTTKCKCAYVCHEFCMQSWFKTSRKYTCLICKCSDGRVYLWNDICITGMILTYSENILEYVMRFDNGFDRGQNFALICLVVQIILILFITSFMLFIAFIHVIILKKTR